MARESAGERQDRDRVVEEEAAELNLDRRHLLGGATGGLFMAASGLFLPNWLAETDAREGALDGAKGGRRGKDQRGRHKKRTHGNEKDRPKENDKPRGLGLKGIRLKVVNETDFSFPITAYWAGSIGWYLKWKNLNRRGSILSSFTEDTEELHAGISFSTEKDPFVWIENPFAGTPNTTYQYGGSMTPLGYRGGTVDVDHGTLEENAETIHRIPFSDSRTYAVKVRREGDVPGFKVFTMTVLPN